MTERTPDAAVEPRDPDALRRRAGVQGDPGRDQHFLVDDRILDRIAGYLPDGADTTHLLEIGGGTGGLTDRLLRVGERVTVIERDPALAGFLREEFEADVDAGRLRVIGGDAVEVDLPEFSACVSNLPYGVSSPIAFRLLPRSRPLVLTFQREFAERMAADPGTGDYGRLDFVKALFTQRRKTVRNGIRNTAHISGLSDPEAVIDAAAAADGELLSARPGSLAPPEFAALTAIAADYGR